MKCFMLQILNVAVVEVENNLHDGVGFVHITKDNLERIKIPLPPLAIQQAIVAEIEIEQALVTANYLQLSEQKKLHIPFQSFSKKIDNAALFHAFLSELIIVGVRVHEIEITV